MIKQKFIIVNGDMKMRNMTPFVKASAGADEWTFSKETNSGLKAALLRHLTEKYPNGIDVDDDAFDSLIPDMNKVCKTYFKGNK